MEPYAAIGQRLKESNEILAACFFPEEGVTFLPVTQDDVSFKLGRMLGLSEFATVLGSSYFQRLLRRSTAMQNVMKQIVQNSASLYTRYNEGNEVSDSQSSSGDAGDNGDAADSTGDADADSVLCLESLKLDDNAERQREQSTVVYNEPFPIALTSIDLEAIMCMCLGIAGQVVDPYYVLPIGRLRFMLERLYRCPVVPMSVCHLQEQVLKGLEWRLGPFFRQEKEGVKVSGVKVELLLVSTTILSDLLVICMLRVDGDVHVCVYKLALTVTSYHSEHQLAST